jgi:hypothetical protein
LNIHNEGSFSSESQGRSGVSLLIELLALNVALLLVAAPHASTVFGLAVGLAGQLQVLGYILQASLNVFDVARLSMKSARGQAEFGLGKLLVYFSILNLPFLLFIAPGVPSEAATGFRWAGVVVLGLYDLMALLFAIVHSQRSVRVLREGEAAMARVISFESRGTDEARTTTVTLRLQVEPSNGEAFESEARLKVYQPLPGETYSPSTIMAQAKGVDLRKIQPGMQVPVKFDPLRKDRVFVAVESLLA